MPIGQFESNVTASACTAPLLDEALFGKKGGYQPGRYCSLGSSEDGTKCCFPCPIQDWVYPPVWKQQIRVPNYLSILSVILCGFLLLSFAVLPPEKTHRHYLSVGLLFPVLFISLSFVIPVGSDPQLCYDDITPNNMRNSPSCAWTGSLVVLGGLGCVIWVFLRSLWLHIRIFWDRDPGWYFKCVSIIVGTTLPLFILIALVAATGLSYRMGQTCLPNQEHSIITFWVWLVVFAIAGFLLQSVTTVYCVYVYTRTRQQEGKSASMTSTQRRGNLSAKLETWNNVKHVLFLQWRNLLVSVFVIFGSIGFFIVFWTQDGKLGMVFNNAENIMPVETWVVCLTLYKGDKDVCREYVKPFTVPRGAVLTSLIMASLVGIEIFILLFRVSMMHAWKDVFVRLSHRARTGRPPTPELTSLSHAEKLQPRGGKVPSFASTLGDDDTSTPSPNTMSLSNARNSGAIELGGLDAGSSSSSSSRRTSLRDRPGFERPPTTTSETGAIAPPASIIRGSIIPTLPPSPPHPRSRSTSHPAPNHHHHHRASLPPLSASSSSPSRRNSRPRSRCAAAAAPATRESTSGRSIQHANSPPRISAPIQGSFRHVSGNFMGRGAVGLHPMDEVQRGWRTDGAE
ncbi:hypothetical protein K504DRAFT_204898 [Pleomassaria siparia CBS 279.74]|uniref:G-protein coupled receptors family 2 profile 2 domain-containing protein n=1 Tax=Pleomassaria siparia CBS 279.74 TaxID=1314801 RepID=A0A6G1KI19_9PLEO|nr:hypothetical protein K504DRAFT_204898 [Pleomassaria siparia CBS 279.74]